jgi:hypothetical protein
MMGTVQQQKDRERENRAADETEQEKTNRTREIDTWVVSPFLLYCDFSAISVEL